MEQTADPFVTVFNKVIQQSMKSGNDGVFVECCHVFFTRTSKHHAEKHHGKPISVKVWCRFNEIESAEDLRKYWEEKELEGAPQINDRNCKTEVERLEKLVEALRKQIDSTRRVKVASDVDMTSLVSSESQMSEVQSHFRKLLM